MNLPFEYDRVAVGEFGGTTPTTTDFEQRPRRDPSGAARSDDVVRAGTRNGPARDPRGVVAHGALGRGDRDRRAQHRHLHAAGNGVSVRDDGRGDARRSAASRRRSSRADKFPFVLGGEHSITAPVVAALAAKHPGLSVLQIDAHADLRDSFMGTPHNHACAMRRVLEYARATQVGIRSLSPEEAAAVPTLPTRSSTTSTCGRMRNWIERVVDSLGETVYITIDCDGLDPAIMPAVGTPEPGGLSWYETLALLRRVIESRQRRRVRSRGAVPDAGQRRAQLPLREARSTRFCRTGSATRSKVPLQDGQGPLTSSSAIQLPPARRRERRVGKLFDERLNVCSASARLPASRYVRPSCIRMPSTGSGPSFCCARSLKVLMPDRTDRPAPALRPARAAPSVRRCCRPPRSITC